MKRCAKLSSEKHVQSPARFCLSFSSYDGTRTHLRLPKISSGPVFRPREQRARGERRERRMSEQVHRCVVWLDVVHNYSRFPRIIGPGRGAENGASAPANPSILRERFAKPLPFILNEVRPISARSIQTTGLLKRGEKRRDSDDAGTRCALHERD